MKTNLKKAAITVLAALMFTTNVFAQDSNKQGHSIAARSDQSDNGFRDSIANLTMILTNAQGQKTERTLVIQTLERASNKVGDKTVVLMTTPADVKGTAFLSHAQLTAADGQWIFLPALKRVKRIASSNKSGPFLGSEFSYEDFTSQELGKYSYKYVREEACGPLACAVLERTPLYDHSGYSRQLVWIDQTNAQFRKIDFFDRANHHVKTLTFSKYQRYKNAYWRAHELTMINHRSGKATTLAFDSFSFGKGLSTSDFVKGSLARLR